MKATVASVAKKLTLARVAELAEEAARLDAVKMREALTPSPSPRGRGGELVGRPEYRSLRHARLKERLYAQWRERQERSRREMVGIWQRWAEQEARKERLALAWLDFDPEAVAVNWEFMPDF